MQNPIQLLCLNNICRQLEANHIRILRCQRPVDDQLQFGIHLEHGEGILVDILGAGGQRTFGRSGSVLEEELITGGGSVDTDEGQRNADDIGVNGCGEFFDVFFCR